VIGFLEIKLYDLSTRHHGHSCYRASNDSDVSPASFADRNDVGGVSIPSHNGLQGKCGIFVYNGHRREGGYTERRYEIIAHLLKVTIIVTRITSGNN
jgi:hypothetical protein